MNLEINAEREYARLAGKPALRPSPNRCENGEWRASAACALLLFVVAGCATHIQAPVQERSPLGNRNPLAAVQTAPPAAAPREVPMYTVKKGDTLYLIALDHGHDYKDIAAWNNIDNPDRIRVGQVLRLGALGESETAPVVGNAQVNPVLPRQPVDARPLGGTGGAVGAGAPAAAGRKPEAQVAKVDTKPDPATAAKPAGSDDEEKIDWGWPAQGKMLGSFSEATNKGIDISGKVGDPVIASASGKVVYSGTGLRGYGKLIIIKHNANFLSAYAHNSQILVKESQLVTKGQKIAEVGSSDAEQPMLHFEIRKQGKPVDPMKYLPGHG